MITYPPSFNLGSIDFSMHPVVRRFQPEEWKHDWEKGYVEGVENFIFSNTFGSMEIFARTMVEHNITPESVMVMKETCDRLFEPENYRWSVLGVGYPYEFNMAVMAIIMGGHVRVGLEDNIYVRRRQLARNHELVEKVVRLADELERPTATPDEARQMLGLKGKDSVNVEVLEKLG